MPGPKTQSHPIDRHVGARLRMRRGELNLSQAALAARLGVTFQAVQKYEVGSVRVSASRLYELARALSTTPSFFFEAYDEQELAEAPAAFDRRDVAALLRGYSGISDARLQADLRRLIATLGEESE